MVFWDVKLRQLVERQKGTSTVLVFVYSGTGICAYLFGGSLRASAAEGRCGVQLQHNTSFPSLPPMQRIWASYIINVMGEPTASIFHIPTS